MNLELIGALSELERERGISKAVLLDAIESAIVTAYKRNYSASSASVRVDINESTGEIHVYSRRVVVTDITDASAEISLEDAKEIDPNYTVGHVIEEEVTPRNFGRIAAQTAKQIVIQKIREAERSNVFSEYSQREGDVVTGIVQRFENRNVVVDLSKVEAVLPASEQINRESYVPNARMKFYINEVRQSSKGPQVFLSRIHPGLLKNLFELEVPEIHSGDVEIKAVSREAGNRSKIAVYSRDPNVDPVGSCVGSRGMRVQAVVAELNGEKIDIVEWIDSPQQFIANALSPAKVLYVNLDPENKIARTVVPDDQLSLAIGKEGQNARLAARLTNWKIDIKSVSQAADAPEFQPQPEPKTLAELAAAAEAAPESATSVDPDAAAAEEPAAAQTDIDEAPQPAAPESVEATPKTAAMESKAEETKKAAKKKERAAVKTSAIDPSELASLTNVRKRKTWEERFGTPEAKTGGKTEEAAPDTRRKKKAKDEKDDKVIKDFAELELEDFGFKKKK